MNFPNVKEVAAYGMSKDRLFAKAFEDKEFVRSARLVFMGESTMAAEARRFGRRAKSFDRRIKRFIWRLGQAIVAVRSEAGCLPPNVSITLLKRHFPLRCYLVELVDEVLVFPEGLPSVSLGSQASAEAVLSYLACFLKDQAQGESRRFHARQIARIIDQYR